MNHPWTSCMSLSDFLKSTGRPDRQTSPPQQNHNETPASNEPSRTTESTDHSREVYPEDLHPNVPHIFGSGPDLIDVFNADRHAKKRRDNIYYPFSSKEEWSLASWLLCSGLSMRAIDDFLSLPIVSPISCVIQSTLTKTRSDNYRFRSQLQIHSVLAWRIFQRRPHGKCKTFLSPVTRLQNLSFYSITIHWNVFKHFSETLHLRGSGPFPPNESMMTPADKTVSTVIG